MRATFTRFILFVVLVCIAHPAVAQNSGLPPDVHPDSLNRLPLPRRDELDAERQKAYDAAFAKTNSLEGLRGEVGIRLQGAAKDIRFESPLGRRLTELAIIVGARHAEQNFEWTLHVEEALRQGLEMPVIDVVRYRKPTAGAPGLGDKEAAIINVGREMAERHFVSPATFAQALQALGKGNLVDMFITMATRANETSLIWVDQHLPLDWQEKVPMGITVIPSPPDIFPKSRSRLRQKEGQRPGTPGRTLAPDGMGPGQIALHTAEGKFLDAVVGKQLRELALLVTARELDQQVMWTEHEPIARKVGVGEAVIEAVRNRKPLAGLSAREATVIQMGRELLTLHHVAPETYASAVDLFGDREALDLATEIGDHALTAGILNAFNQQLPPNVQPLLPIPAR